MSFEQDRVLVFDTTLRDGEQSPGISLDIEEKIEIADQLGQLGVDIIEAGFPIASQGDFEAVQGVAEVFADRPTVICGLSRTALADIDRCWEAIQPAANKRIHTFIATSERHMVHKLRKTPEQVIQEAQQAVSWAKQYTDDVEFSPEDATRSNFDFMCQVLQGAVDAGATTLNIPDTVGFTQPGEYTKLITDIRQRVSGVYVLSTHCHDDLGMAVANTMAGIQGGARQVEVTINGLGERAGNAALEEVVMNLDTRSDYFGGVTTRINKAELLKTSQLVAGLSGYPVQYNKAVVGRNAFAHESGIHQDGVIKDRETYEIMDPVDVGQISTLEIGKLSGSRAIAQKLDELHLPTTETRAVRDACKSYHEQTGRTLTDVEIEEVAMNELGIVVVDKIIPLTVETSSTGENAEANLSCQIDDEDVIMQAKSDGEIGAGAFAIIEHFPGYQLTSWVSTEAKNEHGAQATGGAHCTVKTPYGTEITSYDEGKNVVHASINAFIRAINCAERVQARTVAQQA